MIFNIDHKLAMILIDVEQEETPSKLTPVQYHKKDIDKIKRVYKRTLPDEREIINIMEPLTQFGLSKNYIIMVARKLSKRIKECV